MNRKITLFFVYACILGGALCAKHLSDGFTILGISSNRPYHTEWETRELGAQEKEVLQKALSQKYHYLDHGGQSFIFVSEDEEFVIKFFKQRIFTVPLWVKHFPIPYVLDRYRAKKTWKREDKLNRDFASYKAGFEELKEETGLVFVHLNKSFNLQKKLTIVDKCHIEHVLDMDSMDFVIQRKAELVYDRIHFLMGKGQQMEAKLAIKSILDLIVIRCKKGFHDRDPEIATNCGFIDGKAIKIDVGRFTKEERMKDPAIYQAEVARLNVSFKKWLDTTYPSLSDFFEQEMKNYESPL